MSQLECRVIYLQKGRGARLNILIFADVQAHKIHTLYRDKK
jgi:hypothetical protein